MTDLNVQLHCPSCHATHECASVMCEGLQHDCHHCAHRWQPFTFRVRGIGGDRDESDAVVVYAEAPEKGYDGLGFYYYDSEYPDEGSCGAFLTLEETLQDAMQSYTRAQILSDALKAAQGEVLVG